MPIKISKKEMMNDIKELILLVSAFTKEDTAGYDYLQKLIKKYEKMGGV